MFSEITEKYQYPENFTPIENMANYICKLGRDIKTVIDEINDRIDPECNLSALPDYQIRIMSNLVSGPCTVSKTAKYCAINEKNINKSINKLLDLGFIEKFKKQGEKKAVYLRLSTKGENFIDTHNKLAGKLITDELLEDFTNEELNDMYRIFENANRYISILWFDVLKKRNNDELFTYENIDDFREAVENTFNKANGSYFDFK